MWRTAAPTLLFFVVGVSGQIVFEEQDGRRQSGRFRCAEETVHVEQWTPVDQRPKGLVYIAHGLGEYLWDGYAAAAGAHADNGFLVFGNDHIGHGRSSGERVQIRDFSDHVDCSMAVIRAVMEANPGTPVFIVGQGMGGLIAVHAMLRNPKTFSGAILTNPLLEVHPDFFNGYMFTVIKFMHKLAPDFRLGSVKPAELTSNRSWVRRIRADPLIFKGGLKSQHMYETIAALDRAQQRLGKLAVPVLIQHGKRDRISSIKGSRLIERRAKDATLSVYKGAKHNLFVEKDAIFEKVVEEQKRWLNKRSK